MRFKLVLAAGLSLIGAPLLVFSAGACKGRIIIPGTGGTGSSASTSSLPGLTTTTGASGDAGKDAFDDYMDPPCKNKPPPIEDFQCKPYAQGNGDCAKGQACYIYVQYPTQPCGAETYGAVCETAGIGAQGAACQGPTDCVAGASCVITGSGNQCVMLCPLMGASNCPSGTVCEPIDVSGFGGCL